MAGNKTQQDFFHIRLEGLDSEKWTVIDLALGAYGSIIDWLERAWAFFIFIFIFSEMGFF
jgi:hypothetical protein